MTSQSKTKRDVIWFGELADSPLGAIWIATSPRGLVAVNLWEEQVRLEAQVLTLAAVVPTYAPEKVAPVATQFTEYFSRERKQFDLAIDWSFMTPFQEQVLQQVATIPYGRTRTYGDIAEELGKPSAVRAVGRANATNPMPIIIPCHRVLGADGRLHGYAAPGGLETKAWLLRLEGSWLI